MYSFVCYVCFWCTFSCTAGRSPVCCLLFVRSFAFSPHFTFSLKLVRAHINYRFTTPQFFKNHLSLYAPITSDECHCWFHLYGLSQAAWNEKQTKISKMKYSCPQWDLNSQPSDYESNVLSTWPSRLVENDTFLSWCYYTFSKYSIGTSISITKSGMCEINRVCIVVYFSHITSVLLQIALKYLHWSICKTIEMLYDWNARQWPLVCNTSRGLEDKTTASQAKGRGFESHCGQDSVIL